MSLLAVEMDTARPSVHERIRELSATAEGCAHLSRWCGRWTPAEAAHYANVLLFKRAALLPRMSARIAYGSVEWRVEHRRRYEQVDAEVLVMLEMIR